MVKRFWIGRWSLAAIAFALTARAAAPVCGPVSNNAQTCTYTRAVTIWVGTVTVVGAQASNSDHIELTELITGTLAAALSNDATVDARVRAFGVLGNWVNGQGDMGWVQDAPQNFAAQTKLIQDLDVRTNNLNTVYGVGPVVVSGSFVNHPTASYSLATWETSSNGVAIHNIGTASVTIFEEDITWTAPGSKGPGGFSGSMAQVASAGGWGTLFTLVNTGATASSAHLDFFDDNGAPLPLPVSISGGSGAVSSGPVTSVDQALNPGASVIFDSTGDSGQAQVVGWAQLLAPANVSGFGIFRFPAVKWEAVVPLETRTANSYFVVFDNTGFVTTGVAVANIASANAAINVVIRNDAGTQIGTAVINLSSQGHTAFMLNQRYAITAGKRGTIEFKTPTGGQISVLGLRANGSALTTVPVLANVAPGSGSIAHVTFSGGFNSLIYLVNTGSAAASFTLSFFDESGNPLNVSLFLLNPGTPVSGTALTRTLAAGAMLAINVQTQGSNTMVGSAQLTSGGNIGGFEIFQWTTFGQEATVPVETRTPNSYVLAFDDTNGLTTGVALSNPNGAAISVLAKLSDTGGTPLQPVTIDLPAHGHTSFLLPDRFSLADGRAGIVEFVVPVGKNLGVIGLRAKADGTLTTIPLLVK